MFLVVCMRVRATHAHTTLASACTVVCQDDFTVVCTNGHGQKNAVLVSYEKKGMHIKARAMQNGSLPLRIGAGTLITRFGTCDMLHTIMLHQHDSILREVQLQEGDTANIRMRRAPKRRGMQDHYVRWVKVGTSMVEMAQHELRHWLLPRMKGNKGCAWGSRGWGSGTMFCSHTHTTTLVPQSM